MTKQCIKPANGLGMKDKSNNTELTNMAKKKEKQSSARLNDVSEKMKALKLATEHINKDHGNGSVMCMGDDAVEDVEVIPTGSLGLDYALGVGGLPRGRIVEIYGPESSGKTTLAIHAIAEAQKLGGLCALIDAEHAFDRAYAEKLGVDINSLWVAQPDCGEQALDIAEQLINSGAIDMIVIDSVAALTPKAEIEGEMGDKNVGLHARLMSQAMRKLTASISRTRTCCIFINQIREKIGIMFGNPETTTGGNALKFYSSVRLEIRGGAFIKDGDATVGRTTKVKVVKNKVAPPFMRAEFDIMFGEGISRSGEILDMAVELGIVKKSGAWFSYNGSKLGQGRDAVRDMIGDNPELADELAALIRQQLEAKREESKKHNSTFVPGKKEDDADADAEGGDDMFGDDFVDIEES
jgi:recombination protein RecA